MADIKELRAANKPSVPSTIAKYDASLCLTTHILIVGYHVFFLLYYFREKLINPFMRVSTPNVKAAVNGAQFSDVETMKAVRALKDNFKQPSK